MALRAVPVVAFLCAGAVPVQASMLAIGLRDWDTLWVQSYREDGVLRVLLWNRSEEPLEIQFFEVRFRDDGLRLHRRTEVPLGGPFAIEAGSVVSMPRPQVAEGSYVGIHRNGDDIGILTPTRGSPVIDRAPHAIALDGFVNGSFAPSTTGPAVLTFADWPAPGDLLDFEIVVAPHAEKLMLGCFDREDWPCREPANLECLTGVVTVAPDSSSVEFDGTHLPEGMPHRIRGLVGLGRDLDAPVTMIGAIVQSRSGSHGFVWMIPFAASISPSSDRK